MDKNKFTYQFKKKYEFKKYEQNRISILYLTNQILKKEQVEKATPN